MPHIKSTFTIITFKYTWSCLVYIYIYINSQIIIKWLENENKVEQSYENQTLNKIPT